MMRVYRVFNRDAIEGTSPIVEPDATSSVKIM